jgi:hypothetical protein
MDWLVVSRAYWCCGEKFYDVVLSDSRTDPPAEVALVTFHRGSSLTGKTDTVGSVGFMDAYYEQEARDFARGAVLDGAHEYYQLWRFHQPAMRDLARAYMRAHTTPTRWRPRAHADVHVDNTVSARLRKRARP